MTNKELNSLTAFASELAMGAGRILKDGIGCKKDIRLKGRIDPVTKYDLKSERHIIAAIKKEHPSDSILSEESPRAIGPSSRQWVIDPLDGTVNYAHGLPIYCVSIALQESGNSVVGVVYDPERDELFSAKQGRGACLNGKKLRVSRERKLSRALLATGFAYDVATAKRNNLGLFARMVKKAQAVRRPGSAAIDLCWLAAGRIDGFWEFSLHPWDTAAAMLMVAEAGGRVTRLDGQRYSVFHDSILASNNLLHNQLRRVLTGQADRRSQR